MNTKRADQDDDALALAAKAGDRLAYDELVRRHQARVYGVAYRFASNREDALDIAQEALFKAYRKIGSWEPRSGFVPWLLRLTANHAIDHLRRAKRRKNTRLANYFRDGEAEVVSERQHAQPGTRARAEEIGNHVQRALDVLSSAQRQVFVLRHYEGLQLAEIADAMGCSIGSVKVHLFRAVRKLRDELKDVDRF
ncbi:MAG: sigma-70 family RNA polymerase sigma factor [Candidatus Hydrogenedentota bacterium]